MENEVTTEATTASGPSWVSNVVKVVIGAVVGVFATKFANKTFDAVRTKFHGSTSTPES